jgi:nucleotide-binding universal stress UspA family protein
MVTTEDDVKTDAPGTSETVERDEGRWIVGIDGSDCASNALRWAIKHAPGRATDLELVTAWQSPVVGAYPMSSPAAVLTFDDIELRDRAGADTERLAESCRSELDLPVEAFVGRGGPAEVLLAAADTGGLLVIGSRGRGGFARLLLGSTSTQCATHARCRRSSFPAMSTRSTRADPRRIRRLRELDGRAAVGGRLRCTGFDGGRGVGLGCHASRRRFRCLLLPRRK